MTLHPFTQQVCKATRLNLRTDSPPEPHKVITCITPFQENNPYKRKGPRNGQMGKKKGILFLSKIRMIRSLALYQ